MDRCRYLASKALRERRFSDKSKLAWHDFNRVLLPTRAFSFWLWFYSACELTRKFMCDLWQRGAIVGFIAREEAEAALSYVHWSAGLAASTGS